MNKSPIKHIAALEPLWQTPDPFLFCAYHLDFYPSANAIGGPDASLAGHISGQDFDPPNGDPWRMYHGQHIPGFPGHPHRGFETVTVTEKGTIDHADSMGASGRYGNGDTQWMTAGRGVQHSEMFPLLDQNNDNPLELFQIWLNLPASNKMCEPYFGMFWAEQTPVVKITDSHGRQAEITIIAGDYCSPEATTKALPPAPDSWAANTENHVAIWKISVADSGSLTLPAAVPGLNRRLYFYQGSSCRVQDQEFPLKHYVDLDSAAAVTLTAVDADAKFLLLQGRPINEPVASHGPFVMNTPEQLQQTFVEYQATQFGGWPWQSHELVHPLAAARFARYADGREERPG